MATGFVWLTNLHTSEPVAVRLDQVLIIEQKRPQDGGAVAVYLAHGKELYVSESVEKITRLIEDASA